MAQHNQVTGVETGFDRRHSFMMDTASCGGRDETRSDLLLPDDLEEHDDLDDHEDRDDEHNLPMDQRSAVDTDDCDRAQSCSMMNMDDMHAPDSLDMDESASCQLGGGHLGDPEAGYHRLASLGIPSVHSGHSQPALGEDSLSELVTDGQLLSNQLLAQSDDPDLDNAVNSILFA